MEQGKTDITYEQYQRAIVDRIFGDMLTELEAEFRDVVACDASAVKTLLEKHIIKLKEQGLKIAEECFRTGYEQGAVQQADVMKNNIANRSMEALEDYMKYQKEIYKQQDEHNKKQSEQMERLIETIASITNLTH